MKVELPADVAQLVESVACGEYNSAEDAVAEGVGLLMSRRRLLADVQQGIDELDAGQGVDGQEVFAELREQAKQRIDQAGLDG